MTTGQVTGAGPVTASHDGPSLGIVIAELLWAEDSLARAWLRPN